MNELLSKQGETITYSAQLLLRTRIGDRLPAMQQIASEKGVSVGTVQAAMQFLQSTGIVEVENRGRLGAYVRNLDYVRLWPLGMRRAMCGMFPMPYSRRVEGLATAMRQSFDHLGLNFEMRFMRGSTSRLQRLHGGQCDWVVTSRYAAESAWVHGFDVEILLSLGAGTYTVDHVLLLNGSDQLLPDMRVGIDTHSADHAYVVRLLSNGTPVNFVEIDYSNTIDLLIQGEIDATVWTEQDIPPLPDHIHTRPLNDSLNTDDKLTQLGEAVLVGLSTDTPVTYVIQSALKVDHLRDIQQRVVDGQIRATY